MGAWVSRIPANNLRRSCVDLLVGRRGRQRLVRMSWDDEGMKVSLRADASPTIGTGHVMRQLALAEVLMSRGARVTLVGSVTSGMWVSERILSVAGLDWLQVDGGDSPFNAVKMLSPDCLVLDSYFSDATEISVFEKIVPRVAVIVDGPWQKVGGMLGISPVLDKQSPWLGEYQDRFTDFYAGPEFVVLRREIIELGVRRFPPPNEGNPRVVVSLGGADPGKKAQQVWEALSIIPIPLAVEVFTLGGLAPFSGLEPGPHSLKITKSGSDFVRALATADLAISAAGTSSHELSYLGIPSIFIPVAENQAHNVAAIERLGLGTVVTMGKPNFQKSLAERVLRLLSEQEVESKRPSLLDGQGSGRMADILMGSTQGPRF